MVSYAYLDSSAIVKLVVAEAGTSVVEAHAARSRGLLTSRLAATEVARAARRQGQRRLLQQVDDVLESLVLLEVTAAILKRAAALNPPDLRTLDAIHLATALSLGITELDFLTFDRKLADAAAAHGLRVARRDL